MGVETHNCASLRGGCVGGWVCRDKACLVSTAIGGDDRPSTTLRDRLPLPPAVIHVPSYGWDSFRERSIASRFLDFAHFVCYARNDGVRVGEREKREATKSPLFFLPLS